MSTVHDCPLCTDTGGLLITRGGRWRVVRAEDADFPATYRVVWNAHVAELSELTDADRHHFADAANAVERALRATLAPTKVNVASLGNVVPHLHWHVIARFGWDSHFPQPVWGLRQRVPAADPLALLVQSLPGLDAAVAEAVRALAR